MLKFVLSLSLSFFMLIGYQVYDRIKGKDPINKESSLADDLRNASKWPADIDVSHFTGSELTPSPPCLAVHANGTVFVGVDKIGSLGKTHGKGSIIKLVDNNNDRKVDSF